jgi:hypothetical protein
MNITSLTTTALCGSFHVQADFTAFEASASLDTASTSGAVQLDVKVGGVSRLSTLVTVDANEQTSYTAAAPAASGSILSKMMPRPPTTARPKTAGVDRRAGGPRQLWVLRDGQPVAMQVKTGISDGRNTEVSGEGLTEGLAVITEQRASASGS